MSQTKQNKMSQELSSKPSLEKLHQIFHPQMTELNQVIIDSLNSRVPLIPQLAQYLIQAGGKRLRPHMTLAAAQLFNYQGNKNLCLAASVELIHSATLLHDDVVDGSSTRRGKDAANTLWDNKSAVLVGDFLFARAFELMVQCQSLPILDTLSSASAKIVEGEVLQLTTANNIETSVEQYMHVVKAKTAILFGAACKAGAQLANASEKDIENIFSYGINLGIAFQISDDILDFLSSGSLGKEVGDDFRDGKVTLPVIIAYSNASSPEEKAFWDRTINKSDHCEADLQKAMAYLHQHNAFQKSLDYAYQYSQKSIDNINNINIDSEITDALIQASKFSVQRAQLVIKAT